MRIEAGHPAVGNKSIVITTSTAASLTQLPEGGEEILIENTDATNAVYIEIGDSSVVATTTTSMRLSGTKRIQLGRRGTNTAYISLIAGGGTPAVYITVGTGIMILG